MIEPLTVRETETVRLLAEGMSNREIAHSMTVHWTTVRTHVLHSMQKSGCHNRVELTLWAQRNGIVDLPILSVQSGMLMIRDLRRIADQYEQVIREVQP